MLRIIPLCLIMLITTSCFVDYKTAVDSLKESAVCCGSLAEFKYEPIPKEGVISFKIDKSSAAFMFQSGKSYFKAFALPMREGPYYLHIKSFGLGEQIRDAHIFYPQVALLDEQFTVLKQSDSADFSLKKAGPAETASVSWTALPIKVEGSFLVENPQTKHIVLFTSDKLLAASSPFLTMSTLPVILPGIVTALPAGQERVRIRHSPFGMLHIEIADKPLPVADEIPHGDRLRKRIQTFHAAQAENDVQTWYEMTTPFIREKMPFELFKKDMGLDQHQEKAEFKITGGELHKICLCDDWTYEDGRETSRCSLLVYITAMDDKGQQEIEKRVETWEYVDNDWYWVLTDHHKWEDCPTF